MASLSKRTNSFRARPAAPPPPAPVSLTEPTSLPALLPDASRPLTPPNLTLLSPLGPHPAPPPSRTDEVWADVEHSIHWLSMASREIDVLLAVCCCFVISNIIYMLSCFVVMSFVCSVMFVHYVLELLTMVVMETMLFISTNCK